MYPDVKELARGSKERIRRGGAPGVGHVDHQPVPPHWQAPARSPGPAPLAWIFDEHRQVTHRRDAEDAGEFQTGGSRDDVVSGFFFTQSLHRYDQPAAVSAIHADGGVRPGVALLGEEVSTVTEFQPRVKPGHTGCCGGTDHGRTSLQDPPPDTSLKFVEIVPVNFPHTVEGRLDLCVVKQAMADQFQIARQPTGKRDIEQRVIALEDGLQV